jgi:hypothetical protein
MSMPVMKRMKWNEKNEMDFKNLYGNKMNGHL